MESNELRFKRVGLSSDATVIFCEMDNGKTYSMPLSALEQTEEWNPQMRPKAIKIIHDGYAAIVDFNTGAKIDFPSDFVRHVCEPSYAYHKRKGRASSGIGARIREIRQARGLTLDALAAKSGIAKPNLSRLEHDKVTPTFETLRTIAAALDTHPCLLVSSKKPEHAWTWTRHAFAQWKLDIRFDASTSRNGGVPVSAVELVNLFLSKWPEHAYARTKLLEDADLSKYLGHSHDHSHLRTFLVDAAKWAREIAAVQASDDSRKQRRLGSQKAHSR